MLSDVDLARILKACAGKEFRDRRDEAVIRVLLDCGIRVSELCGNKVTDLDLDREVALVTGKGNKVRPVYFGARTARALDRYIRDRKRKRHAHLDALFLSRRGALSPDGVRERVNVRGAAAGVPGLHPHRFRHTFRPRLPHQRGTGTRSQAAGRLVVGCDARALRRQRRRRAGSRGRETTSEG